MVKRKSSNDEFLIGEDEAQDPSRYNSHLLSNDDPEYLVNNKEVVVEGTKSITKMILLGVIGLVFIITLVYALFSATLMYLAPSVSDGGNERLHVARNTYTAGHIPAGSVMYGSATNQASTGFFTNMTEGFVGTKDPIIVETIVGPVNVLDSKDGKLTIDGKKTDIKSSMDRMVLDDQFLVKCLAGNCSPGTYFVINLDGLSGEVVGTLEETTYSKVNSAADIEREKMTGEAG